MLPGSKRYHLSRSLFLDCWYLTLSFSVAGFNGPNIYIRALFALQSGIPEEQFYALHHLVKISHERGDKYRFDGFPGLAEALISKILEVTSLFYNVQWKISYSGNDNDNEAIEGLHGTKNLSYKLQTARPLPSEGDLDTQESAHSLGLINEATLVLRNMILLDENATYASKLPAIHDLLTILLHLPQRPSTVEIRHYALEIAEQLTKFYKLEADDPLYLALISELDSSDRGAIVTSLRALSRISMNLETANQLKDVPVEALKRVVEWLLVEDEELSHACLDFLYQFTARIENVEMLLRHVDMDGLVSQLVRLTMYNAVRDERKERSRAQPKTEAVPTHPPKLSLDIVNLLNRLEEPERSSQW